jgi:hypothetical protein
MYITSSASASTGWDFNRRSMFICNAVRFATTLVAVAFYLWQWYLKVARLELPSGRVVALLLRSVQESVLATVAVS